MKSRPPLLLEEGPAELVVVTPPSRGLFSTQGLPQFLKSGFTNVPLPLFPPRVTPAGAGDKKQQISLVFINSAAHLFSFVWSSEGSPVLLCKVEALARAIAQAQPFLRKHTSARFPRDWPSSS